MTESVRVKVPMNPAAYVTVIVENPDAPARDVTLVGFAAILNAVATEYVTVALCDIPLADPVTVTVNDPDVAVATQFIEDVAEVPRVTLVGFREHVRPVLGEIVELRLTVPE